MLRPYYYISAHLGVNNMQNHANKQEKVLSQITDRNIEGKDFSGCDLSGIDLRGIDLGAALLRIRYPE
jgi:uncharacterized protein YjbI with pentapeptide repeats